MLTFIQFLTISVLGMTQDPAITVFGHAELRVPADEFVLEVGISSTSTMVKKAKAASDVRLAKAVEAAKSMGIDASHIQRSRMNISYTYDNQRRHTGFRAQRILVIHSGDLTIADRLIEQLIEAGVDEIRDLLFRTTQLRSYRDQARDLALDAAREKAERLAQRAGVRAGQPLSIDEALDYGGYRSWRGTRETAYTNSTHAVPGSSSSLAEGLTQPGLLKIRSEVSVSYRI